MALIGNCIRLAQGNAFYLGGSGVSGAYTSGRAPTWSPGARRRFAYGEAQVPGVTDRAAVPEGYLPPVCWDMPQKSGGMSSRGRIAGTGTLTADGVNGLGAVADLAGDGNITLADLALILSAVAALTGNGTLTPDLRGVLQAIADLNGSGSVSAALGAIAGLLASLTAAGDASGTANAFGSLSASIEVAGGDILTPDMISSAVWNAASETGFSYAEVIRLITAVAAGKTTITNNGDGTSTVVFRNLADTRDRIEAEVEDNERTALNLDVDY